MITKNELPKPTVAVFEKRAFLEEQNKVDELLDLMNSYDWSDEVFEENGKFGLKSSLGEILLPPKFDDFKTLSGRGMTKGQRLVAYLDGKCGIALADGNGEWLVQPIYDEISFPNSIVAVLKGDKWGVMNTSSGELIIPLELDHVYGGSGFMFVNGMAYFKRDGKCGVMNDRGEFTEAIFEEAEPNDCGEIVVKFNGEEGYIDKNGNFTTENEEAWFMESHY
jgi:hypothetical protein